MRKNPSYISIVKQASLGVSGLGYVCVQDFYQTTLYAPILGQELALT